MKINSTSSEQRKKTQAQKNGKIDGHQIVQNNQTFEIDEEFFKKKEKRNRKYFLKRSISLLQICKQSGKIDFSVGSDFLHIEIMQGGHYPLNQQNLKDICSEIHLNDAEFYQSNLTYSLNNASKCILKNFRNPQSEQNYKSFTQIQQQIKEINAFCENNLKQDYKNCQVDSQQLDSILKQQNNQILQVIQETKQILMEQHSAIKNTLQC
ncbi:unnamed protein product (macronuclear) [Paramecium tetraurelia]|uniref:Uncharacterized protein n=1 Tax=Paramecium tetraurelia TaxID=5888 RepID=A0CW90_PARTE|nr:uncharacterized protein GSPATT00001259001 [Paramecium tetraurelia]CAK75057.1 unnamed protein product [Paramecium tetraurelia]|eukprot:XP_001442454.1 hypothetical protein (macronuclear) [Paramecium tetraurelia strain d4-2]